MPPKQRANAQGRPLHPLTEMFKGLSGQENVLFSVLLQRVYESAQQSPALQLVVVLMVFGVFK